MKYEISESELMHRQGNVLAELFPDPGQQNEMVRYIEENGALIREIVIDNEENDDPKILAVFVRDRVALQVKVD